MPSTGLEPAPQETEPQPPASTTAQTAAPAPLAALAAPTPCELAVLAPMERVASRVTRRMHQGGWTRFCTFCQRTLGMSWIRPSTYSRMRVHGIEHVEAVSHERPILLVSNHP